MPTDLITATACFHSSAPTPAGDFRDLIHILGSDPCCKGENLLHIEPVDLLLVRREPQQRPHALRQQLTQPPLKSMNNTRFVCRTIQSLRSLLHGLFVTDVGGYRRRRAAGQTYRYSACNRSASHQKSDPLPCVRRQLLGNDPSQYRHTSPNPRGGEHSLARLSSIATSPVLSAEHRAPFPHLHHYISNYATENLVHCRYLHRGCTEEV